VRRSSITVVLTLTSSITSGIASSTHGGSPPLEGRFWKVVLVDLWGRSAQALAVVTYVLIIVVWLTALVHSIIVNRRERKASMEAKVVPA
jgi:preprotein translocase subunit SecG